MPSQFPQWLDRYPIVDADHTHDLEIRAAIGEFQHKLPRHEAEAAAHADYKKDQLYEAAAHHFSGIKASHAAGAMEDAKKHGVLYALVMKQLGHDPVAEPPSEVTTKAKNLAETKPVYKFKSHKGDAFALPEAPKTESKPEEVSKSEPLGKMALIHNNAKKPKVVYRVQNEHGEGPYRDGLGYEHGNQPQSNQYNSPLPHEDFTPKEFGEHVLGLGPRGRDDHVFGFERANDARQWFGHSSLKDLYSRGFRVKAIPATKVYRSLSGSQILFKPHPRGTPVDAPNFDHSPYEPPDEPGEDEEHFGKAEPTSLHDLDADLSQLPTAHHTAEGDGGHGPDFPAPAGWDGHTDETPAMWLKNLMERIHGRSTQKSEGEALEKSRAQPVDPFDRIRKLLALGGPRNPNAPERASANARAQQMIKEHPAYPGDISVSSVPRRTRQTQTHVYSRRKGPGFGDCAHCGLPDYSWPTHPCAEKPTKKSEALEKSRAQPVDPFDRIRKLLALGKKNPNVNEGASATAMANKLMQEHPTVYPGGQPVPQSTKYRPIDNAAWAAYHQQEASRRGASPDHRPDAAAARRRAAYAARRQAGAAAAKPVSPGDVIGNTRSGKPVYQNSSPRDYKDFTAHDHFDASRIHYEHPRTIPNCSHAEETKHYKTSDKHSDVSHHMFSVANNERIRTEGKQSPTQKSEGEALEKSRAQPVDPFDRIRKLLALAKKNPNANEGASAMARAQEMIKEHGTPSRESPSSYHTLPERRQSHHTREEYPAEDYPPRQEKPIPDHRYQREGFPIVAEFDPCVHCGKTPDHPSHQGAVRRPTQKSEPLEKRSKNVREQTRNITPNRKGHRQARYLRSVGLDPEERDRYNMSVIGDSNITPVGMSSGNRLVHDGSHEGAGFSQLHEGGHALGTGDGETGPDHQRAIDTMDASAGERDDDVAVALEPLINRRAGVGSKTSRKARVGSAARSKPSAAVRAVQASLKGRPEAKGHIARFDAGSKFDAQGLVHPPSGVHNTVNTGGLPDLLGRLKATRGMTKTALSATKPRRGNQGGVEFPAVRHNPDVSPSSPAYIPKPRKSPKRASSQKG